MDRYREFQDLLCGLTDLELAQAYEQYMDSTNSMSFTAIFWEAESRGLLLTDLEELLSDD